MRGRQMTIQVTPRFKVVRNPNRKRERKSRDDRPGMNPGYLIKIRMLPSCISWGFPVEAHHLKIKDERGVGMRATDRWALPLTRAEHMDLERLGSRREEAWFAARGIACYQLAEALWAQNHSIEAMYRVLFAHFHDRRRQCL